MSVLFSCFTGNNNVVALCYSSKQEVDHYLYILRIRAPRASSPRGVT